MEERIRPILHDIMNSLTIAKGMTVSASKLIDQTPPTPDGSQTIAHQKLNKAIAALEKLETSVRQLRQTLIEN